MADSRRRPPRKRSDFAYGTPSYFEEQDKELGARLRAQLLSASRGSKKAVRGARETERQIRAVRERADFANRVQQQIRAAGESAGYRAERRRQRFIVRSLSRLSAAERKKIDDLLTLYGSRPVPGNVHVGLSKMAWWLFFRAGGQTQ